MGARSPLALVQETLAMIRNRHSVAVALALLLAVTPCASSTLWAQAAGPEAGKKIQPAFQKAATEAFAK